MTPPFDLRDMIRRRLTLLLKCRECHREAIFVPTVAAWEIPCDTQIAHIIDRIKCGSCNHRQFVEQFREYRETEIFVVPSGFHLKGCFLFPDREIL